MRVFKHLVRLMPLISGLANAGDPGSSQNSNHISGRSGKDSLSYDQMDALFEKRDSVSSIESIFNSLNNSDIISDLLLEVASSDAVMDNISDTLINYLETGGGSLGGIKLDLNKTKILDAVKSSGIISSTLDGLLLNDDNRNTLADFTGKLLVNDVWIPNLLVGLGNGHALTVDWIADLIKNSKSKDPNQESKEFKFDKRKDDYSGSAQDFFNNAINHVLQSSLVHQSLGNVLTAMNNSGILVSITMQLVNDPSSASTVIKHITKRVYESGILDAVDLNSYYEKLKKSGKASSAVQRALTDPKYSPGLAKLFQRMDQKGYYQGVQKALYGP